MDLKQREFMLNQGIPTISLLSTINWSDLGLTYHQNK